VHAFMNSSALLPYGLLPLGSNVAMIEVAADCREISGISNLGWGTQIMERSCGRCTVVGLHPRDTCLKHRLLRGCNTCCTCTATCKTTHLSRTLDFSRKLLCYLACNLCQRLSKRF
jgi:hypothetical protein